MTPSEIINAVRGHAPDSVKEAFPDDLHPRLHTEAVYWREMARFLHDDSALAFDWLACVTGVDYVAEDRLCAVYDLYATGHDHWFAVKVYTPRNKPSIPSVARIRPSGNEWRQP